jgi:gliding motility-associated-like protein
MRKILLAFIPLFVLVEIALAQPNISTLTVSAGASGCARSAHQNVIILIQNTGTTDLSNVTFDLTYSVNGAAPITDVGLSFSSFGFNVSQSHTFTVQADLSGPGVYNFTAWISNLAGDIDQTDDTATATVTNTSSVGGIVTLDDTVCQGTNSGTLSLSGQTGSVVRWESSSNGVNWTNIGNAASTTQNYLNLATTTYYRTIVRNGLCAIDSSAYAKITVTPIPYLASTLSTGVCSGSSFDYFPASTVPGSTFTWSRDSIHHITPDSSSGTGNISEVLINDTTRYIYTHYNIVTTANNCSNSGETVNVRVDIAAPGYAHSIAGITPVCQNTTHFPYSTLALNSDTVAWYTWSYTGLGANRISGADPTPFAWGNFTSLYFSATATSGDLTVQGSNYCGSGPASPAYPIQVDTAATAYAGPFDSICQSASPAPVLLSGATVGGPSGMVGRWRIIAGGGSLSYTGYTDSPDTVSYTPAPGYLGLVTIRLTTDKPASVCDSVSSDKTFRMDTAAIAIAGGPDNYCQFSAPDSIVLIGSSVGGPAMTVGTWSILSGTGTLSVLTPTNRPDTVLFYPTPNFGGTITLQLTTNDPGTACGFVTATRTINIDSFALVTAGVDTAICSGSNYTLSGTRSGGATITGWTSTGDGTFDDSTLVNATYTPGATDITNGTVNLIITSNDPAGPCSFAVDTMVLTIDPIALTSAGVDDSVCLGSTYTLSGTIGGSATVSTWTTSGDGMFSDSSLVNAVYTPGIADITLGNVYLIITTDDPAGICSAGVDSMLLIIKTPAFVSAGVDTAICAGSNYTLSGIFSGGASAVAWTTIGDGTFDDTTLVNATYTPGITDVTNGSVTLIVSSDDPSGPCLAMVDSMVLTINAPAIANAGIDDTICSGNTYTLSGSISGSATSSTWTTSGDGTFNDSSLVNAVYTPGTNDTALGNVFLIITTNDPVGACLPTVDTMLLTFSVPALVTANVDDTICAGTTYTLSGTQSGSTISTTWTTNGDGSFDDATLLAAMYTPGTTDKSNGTVTLYITSNDPPGSCVPAIDSMILTINTAAIANAGANDTACTGSPYMLSGLIGGSATSSTWTTAGDGTFNNAALVNAVYTPGPMDIGLGGAYLILTTNDPTGVCTAVFDSVLITVAPQPTVVVTDPGAVCQPLTIDLTDPAVTAGSTAGLLYNYYTNAAATIHVADSTAITATGTYYIVGHTALGCADTSAVNVIVNLSAVGGTVGNDAIVCSGANGDTLTLTGYVGAIQQWQYSTDGGMHWVDTVITVPQLAYSNITTTTWYRAMMTATCASATSVEARITVDSHPASVGGTVSANDTVCSGSNTGTLTLAGNVGNVLRWEYSSDGGNTWIYINNTTNSITYSNISATTYYHAVVQNNICGSATSSNDTITVTTSSTAGTIGSITPGCPYSNGGTLTLNGYFGAVQKWQYSTDGGTTWIDSVNATDTLSYSNLADTTWYRTIVQSTGCAADTSNAATVIIYHKPVANFTADTVCLGVATTFNNTSAVTAGSIQFNEWDFGDNATSLLTAPQHIFGTLGTHTVNLVVISNTGCLDTATVTVVVDTLPNAQITASGSLSFCCGGSVTLTAMPGLHYLWSGSGATTQSIVVSNCNASGNYQLTVSDTAGSSCSNTSSVSVQIIPLPVVDAGNDTTINMDGAVVLNGQGGIVYSWTPVTYLTNPGAAHPVATPASSIMYHLTVTDINGCVNTDSITITVLTSFNNIVVTNLITANGDGYNDKWIISDIEKYPGTEVIIVNREGQQVFYSSYYDNSWDGTGKTGKPLPDGTYYYFIKFAGTDKVNKGPITILNEK